MSMKLRPAPQNEHPLNLFFAAGVATSPQFMSGVAAYLGRMLLEDGWTVHTRLVFPYGDWDQKLIIQLKELRHDLFLRHSRLQRSIGGERLIAEIKRQQEVGQVVLIGHSGGGLASVHAGYLAQDSIDCRAIIQIGSPRYPIPDTIREKTHFIYGVNHQGKRQDPISWIGRWGSSTTRPKVILPIPIQGGHADYFRGSSPFMNSEGQSNLEVTAQHMYHHIHNALCY
jgi:hypothetical protein